MVLLEEIEEHWNYLLRKSRMTPVRLGSLLEELLSEVNMVQEETMETVMEHAVNIMGPIDIKDSLFMAVGLALDLDGIWTEDKHFSKQAVLSVYSTADLIPLLKGGR